MLNHISACARWLIGDGKSVMFWLDKWLNSSLVHQLSAVSISHLLKTLVANFIVNHQWALSSRFFNLFLDCARQILEIPLPIAPECDLLIRENSSSVLFSFIDGYDLVRPHFGMPDWASSVWRGFIPPRYSIIAWRLFHLKLPTDDQLQRRGIPMVSTCQLCFTGHMEDLPHLFIDCSFTQHVWQ